MSDHDLTDEQRDRLKALRGSLLGDLAKARKDLTRGRDPAFFALRAHVLEQETEALETVLAEVDKLRTMVRLHEERDAPTDDEVQAHNDGRLYLSALDATDIQVARP